MVSALGVYACVMRELGEPLCYPGGPPVVKQLVSRTGSSHTYRLCQISHHLSHSGGHRTPQVDSRVLARALCWAAVESHGAAADQVSLIRSRLWGLEL
jgi:hypothetical protein